ncbi:hypothetical protein AO265_35970 [Pseudomonas sp. ABAC61]|nr:hypothetical protein AO265_35970 [Pseudomonas sp. ABAC61]
MNTSALEEMTQLVARHAAVEGASSTANPSLEVARHSTRQTAIRCPQSPFFGMVVQGRMSIQLGETVRHFAQGDYLFVSFSVPVAFHIVEASEDQPCLGFGMAITPERLHEVLARMDIAPRPSSPNEACSVVVDRLNPQLLDATLRLLRLMDVPGDIQSLAPLIEQEIIYRLLSSPYGCRLLQLAVMDSSTNGITRAIDWLRKHYMQPLRIPELADQVGMSESSLHHHFKAITGLTPMQYQKQFRLHEARRLIQIERHNIGNAGFAVGYQSRSQFTREYSRFYGVSPLQHLKDSEA